VRKYKHDNIIDQIIQLKSRKRLDLSVIINSINVSITKLIVNSDENVSIVRKRHVDLSKLIRWIRKLATINLLKYEVFLLTTNWC